MLYFSLFRTVLSLIRVELKTELPYRQISNWKSFDWFTDWVYWRDGVMKTRIER